MLREQVWPGHLRRVQLRGRGGTLETAIFSSGDRTPFFRFRWKHFHIMYAMSAPIGYSQRRAPAELCESYVTRNVVHVPPHVAYVRKNNSYRAASGVPRDGRPARH